VLFAVNCRQVILSFVAEEGKEHDLHVHFTYLMLTYVVGASVSCNARLRCMIEDCAWSSRVL